MTTHPFVPTVKQTFFLSLLFGVFLCGGVSPNAFAAETNEMQLISALQSPSSTLEQKAAACAQLKRIDTDRSVKALAALLADQKLSHSARNALETMPSPKAGKALLRALGMTSGDTQAGIIASLGARHESAAVSSLGKLLHSTNETVALASAQALGRIGGSTALKRLQSAAASSAGPLHQAETAAILACGYQLLDAGKQPAALKVFQTLYDTEKPSPVRQGAFEGVILASGANDVNVAVNAIINGDAATRASALHLATRLNNPEATRQLADLAVAAKSPVQLALIACLVQRNDPAATPAIKLLANDADDSVRLAAITALGGLGDDSCVRLLAEKAAAATGAERDAARESLLDLNHGPVTSRMIELASPASPRVESELILALGARGDQSAVAALLKLARHGNEKERADSFQALGQLADASRIPDLVQLVATAESDDLRSQAADALEGVYQRMPAVSDHDANALVKEIKNGGIETRIALLPICSEITQPAIRDTLRSLITDNDTRTRDAAIHALCETHDPALLPDLLDLAAGKGGETGRHLAVRGAVHLLAQEDDVKFPNDKKLDALEKLLSGMTDAGDKKLVLSGLETVPDKRALALASGLLDDSSVRPETEQAVIHIATAIKGKNPKIARVALNKVLASTSNEDNRKTIKGLLKK